MANKKITKIPLNKECLFEALKLRNTSIRKLEVDSGFSWSTKSVERGVKDGEVSPALLDALGRCLDVDTDYLSGKYHRACETIKDSILSESLKKQLKAEKFPYLLKQHRTKLDDRYLYEKYLEYILIMHDISTRQLKKLTPDIRKEFQLEVEDALVPVLIKYFSQNAKGDETNVDAYKLRYEIDCFDPNEPKEPESIILESTEPDEFQSKYGFLDIVEENDHEIKK